MLHTWYTPGTITVFQRRVPCTFLQTDLLYQNLSAILWSCVIKVIHRLGRNSAHLLPRHLEEHSPSPKFLLVKHNVYSWPRIHILVRARPTATTNRRRLPPAGAS
ncbi:unnamed protein product [Chondrus crispus]|uniref:Uncharacterized protein n=1 Tax=Chondrus crispus TaxID=2769 RepID=R7QDB4_CHOCR|nr:unnamed protein product [Chondrus crispus]CDF35436.1 unnamed protein product [Chondrus crispus]|eukprot:XP_005715255.1 unnamed protein product [Chondrus crispus]